MAPIIVVFVVTAAVVVAVYWMFLERPEAAERAGLQRRLSSIRVTPTVGPGGAQLLRAEEKLSTIPFFDRLLRMIERHVEPLRNTLELADLNWSVGTLVLAMLCAGVAGFVIASLLLRVFWLGVLVGAITAWIPLAYARWAAKRRVIKFEEHFPEAVDLIARALRAGHAFTTGLSMVAEEAPQPVAAEFKRLYDMQNFGMPMPEALREFARRIPLLDAKFFVTAVLTQRESGGNLAEVLDNLSSVIRDRFRVKRQVRVITAHARMTGYVLMGLPPFLAVMFSVTTPGHLNMMLSDPLGRMMIGGAIGLQTVGSLIIRKLVHIEY